MGETNYIVRDLSLSEQGKLKIDWVASHMPVLNAIKRKFETEKPFKGLTIGISLHLEAKTAYLALVLKAGGAKVAITGSNPLSTQDDVAAALVKEGVQVFAWYGTTEEEYKGFLNKVLEQRPEIILDDGGDLVHLLHTERRELLPCVKGGCEETTTGVVRLRAMEADGALEFPMIAVNDAYCKYLFDNRYGTGQSTWDGIMRTTNLTVAGKNVVVIGYGWCGKGVAMRAKGLGANVIVCEVDPVKALEAVMDGYRVAPAIEAAKIGDIFITVTGCKDVLTKDHFTVIKDGAILANAGHFDVEISKKDLNNISVSKRTVRKNIEEYLLGDGRRVFLLAEGRLVNLAAADGHPTEVMDMTFALQAQGLKYIAEHYRELKKKVYNLPYDIDMEVARLRLASIGVEIDILTPEQERYLRSWQG